MPRIFAIVKKELKTYFNSPIAYVFLVVFLALGAWFFFRDFFTQGQVSMRNYFILLPWLFLFLVPAVSMRLWAEERKLRTLEVLLTWPVKHWEAVLGKFFASLAFLMVAMLFTLSLPISLSFLGNLDWGIVITSYLGSLFLAGSYLAIGLWVSGQTENQIVSFILALAACFIFFIIGENLVLELVPISLSPIFDYLGIGTHFESIGRGVIDTRDLVYYVSFIGLFLALNMKSIASRR